MCSLRASSLEAMSDGSSPSPVLRRYRGPAKKPRKTIPQESSSIVASSSPVRPQQQTAAAIAPKPRSKPTSTRQARRSHLSPAQTFPMFRDAVEDGSARFYRLDESTWIAQVLDPSGGVLLVRISARLDSNFDNFSRTAQSLGRTYQAPLMTLTSGAFAA